MAMSQSENQGLSTLTADFYNNVGAAYESGFGHDEGLAKFLQIALSFFPTSSKVLDIGCGTGTPVARTIADDGHLLTGIDIAPSMVELSRKAVPEGAFEIAHALEYQPTEPMDVVLNILSLFTLSREELELHMGRKWAEWLVPDGLLCICTVTIEASNIAKELFDADGLCARGIPVRFMGTMIEATLMTKEFWIRLVEKAGFEILHTAEDLFVPSVDAKSDSEMHFYIIARKTVRC